MSARTLTEIDEEITAVRAAYFAALEAEKLSYSSSTTSRSLERTSSTDLKTQLDTLYTLRTSFGRGSSMKSYSIAPGE
ncbi:MAG: hypothetical protein KAR06_02495 [Deltaproteobacteria bacterium]|nr:hypothetical protein [Deltaproteobacteria bacterium]